jgi:Fur family peroxide stress response transcriptional regulator
MIKHEDIDMKLTPQRLAILNFLDGNLSHPSAADVFKAISTNFPTMSIATVYNTLETLKEKGCIQELGIDSDKKRFDPNPKPHHHLICLNCKEVIDVFSNFSLDLQEKEKFGYEIVGNHVDFYGICPKCKEQKNLNSNIKR